MKANSRSRIWWDPIGADIWQIKYIAIISVILLSNLAKGDEREIRLKEAVEAVRLIWTEWMGNEEFAYDPIESTAVRHYYGTWHGEYVQNGEIKKVTLTIRENGSWSDNLWKPGKTARWYLAEGMIVLFEEPNGETFEGLATVLILKEKTFYLVSNHAKGGLVSLKRVHED